MDFQRGILDYEYGQNKRIIPIDEGTAVYTEYQAGLRYAKLQDELKNDEPRNK